VTTEVRTVAAIMAELASCRLGRIADRLITGERAEALELLADARRAMQQFEAALAAEERNT
jgi:hypothetical protein